MSRFPVEEEGTGSTPVHGAAKWVGRLVEMIDGCDNWKPHPDGPPHKQCITHRYKVRIMESDDGDGYYWAKSAG